MIIFISIMNLLLGKPKYTTNPPKEYCKFNDDRRANIAIEWSHI